MQTLPACFFANCEEGLILGCAMARVAGVPSNIIKRCQAADLMVWPLPKQVQWSQGATQGGSSGAALIDADSRKVVGVLTGGTTTCSIFSGADYFGKLSVVSASTVDDSQPSDGGSVCT